MPLTMTLGGGVGLMSISVIVAEVVMLNCTKEKKLYQKMKTDKLDADGVEHVKKSFKKKLRDSIKKYHF